MSKDPIPPDPSIFVTEREDNFRSEALQEIISRKQGFLTQWALAIISAILVLLFLGTWFIKYPDIIQANATLTAADAPKEIVIRQDGKLVRIFVGNDDVVTGGQTIAWIESTASHSEVLALSGSLDSAINLLTNDKTENVSDLFSKPFYNLGEIQTSYQQFIVAWQQFNDYLVNGYYKKKKRTLSEDLDYLKRLHESLGQQRLLVEQDLDLSKETYDASDSLYRQNVISKQEIRDQKSKLVDKQISLPVIESSILTNESQQVAKQRELDDLEHQVSQQKTIFYQSLLTLKSAADEWIKKYVVRAPVNGKVAFIIPLQENQFIQAGRTIGFVNPVESRFYAQIMLLQNNFGKLDTGQRVQLRFEAYPYQEFGFVEGKLHYISKVPSDSGFLATIELPNGLVTNYKRTIQFRSGLKSQAMIITRNTRLIQRLYYNIIKGVQR
jgi:multidrug efflux pump subunit AcrA (membrane-fusion protein)